MGTRSPARWRTRTFHLSHLPPVASLSLSQHFRRLQCNNISVAALNRSEGLFHIKFGFKRSHA